MVYFIGFLGVLVFVSWLSSWPFARDRRVVDVRLGKRLLAIGHFASASIRFFLDQGSMRIMHPPIYRGSVLPTLMIPARVHAPGNPHLHQTLRAEFFHALDVLPKHPLVHVRHLRIDGL